MTDNATMYSGDSKILTITIRNEAGQTVDVSGSQAIRFGLFLPDGTQVVSKALGTGVSVAAHVITVVLLPDDTGHLLGGSYTMEVEIATATGDVYTVLQGVMVIVRDYLE